MCESVHEYEKRMNMNLYMNDHLFIATTNWRCASPQWQTNSSLTLRHTAWPSRQRHGRSIISWKRVTDGHNSDDRTSNYNNRNNQRCGTTSRNAASARSKSSMATSADIRLHAEGSGSAGIAGPASTAGTSSAAVRASEGISAVMPVEPKPSPNFEMPHLSQWKPRYLPPQSTPINYAASRFPPKYTPKRSLASRMTAKAHLRCKVAEIHQFDKLSIDRLHQATKQLY